MEKQRFGVMMDCSRNGVMTVPQLKRFMDLLVKMGYNCLELYTEDTYEVDGEPYFGYMRGRYTGEEIRELDAYALSLGIELIPAIQTLGHFNALKKNYTLSHLFDIEEILLCEEETTYEFLDKCFASLAKNFTTRHVNIGMDEAHLLGFGKYLKKHGYKEHSEILPKHLARVNEIAQKYGFKPHMWSDMFFRQLNGGGYTGKNLHLPQELIDRIPKNVGLVYWDYYSQDKQLYDDMLIAHKETGNDVWYAGGIWGWNGFAPYNNFTLKPMRLAMQSVKEQGIENVIITVWGDHGKECSYFSLLPALYAVRRMAQGVEDMAIIGEEFEKLIGIPFNDFMLLDLPNDTGNPDFNGTGWPENPCRCLFYQDCFQGFYDADYAARKPIPYNAYARKLKKAEKTAGEYAYIFKYMADLCSFLAVKADLGIKTRAAYRSDDKVALKAIVKDYNLALTRLKTFYHSFYNVWHTENKPFGWEVQDIRLGGLERRIKTCKSVLERYLKGELSRIDELDADVLPTGKVDILENRFDFIVTRNVLN